MGKQSEATERQVDQREPRYRDLEELEFDDDEFFEQYTKHTTKKSTDARRKIEQLREERELQKRLNECYFDE